MIRKIKNNLTYLMLLAAVACSKEEIGSRLYPRVRTNPITEITSTSATFHGTITFTPKNIEDHGFIWASLESLLSLNYAEGKSSLGPRTDTGTFEIRVEDNLQNAIYVTAYAVTDDYVVYGETLKLELK